MAVTLKDVAARAVVSRSAVSRAFTDGASVSTKTRFLVEKAAKEMGSAPNALASSLTTGRTKLIGLIVDNFHNPLTLEVFDLVTRNPSAARACLPCSARRWLPAHTSANSTPAPHCAWFSEPPCVPLSIGAPPVFDRITILQETHAPVFEATRSLLRGMGAAGRA